MNNQVIQIDKGLDADRTGTLRDSSGAVVTSYTSDDTLTSLLWGGDDQSVLLNPTVAWIDAPNGVIQLSFLSADTDTLEPGKYHCRVVVTRASDGRKYSPPDFWVEVGNSPGDANPLPVYSTFEDLLLYAGWLAKQQTASDQAGFAEQRASARGWLESIILTKFRTNLTSLHNTYGNYNTAITAGVTTGASSPWLLAALSNDQLRVTPTVKEIVSRYAISLICESIIGPGDGESPYERIACKNRKRANALVKAYSAEIMASSDYTDTSYPLTVINCGSCSTR